MKPTEQRKVLVERIAAGATPDEALLAAEYTPGTAAARMALAYLESSEGTNAIKRAKITQNLGLTEQADRTDADIIGDLRMVFGMAVDSGDLKSAIKALELEGKHRGTFTDKVEISGKVDVVNVIAAARRRVALENNPSEVIDVDAREKASEEDEDDPIWM